MNPLPPTAEGFSFITDYYDQSTISSDSEQHVRRIYVFGGDRETSREIQLAVARLFRSHLFADVAFTFPCGRRIQAHKAIVYCRLEYYKQMFSGAWASTTASEIPITSVSFEIFQNLIEFAYGTPINISSETVVDLFLAANQFQIPQLQHHCESYIVEGIDDDNVLDLLQLAELFSPYLFQKCLTYAIKHAQQLYDTDAFAHLPEKIAQQIMAAAPPQTLKPVRQPVVSATKLLHELADPFTDDRWSDDEPDSDDPDYAQYIVRRQ